MHHLAALLRTLFSQPGAMLAWLAMGFVSVRAEGLPADTRLRELQMERSQHSALPVPANVSFADVIGNEIEVFDNDNDTHQEGTHAFFIQLGDKTALALGYEHQYGGKGPSEIRFKGQLVKLGPLLRTPSNAAHGLMWVWEAALPAGAVPLVREKLPLPLIMHEDEMTILTAEGAKRAVLTETHPARAILPGQAIGDSAELKLEDADSYKAIRVGDPVIQTRTGIVVAAVGNKEPWIPSKKEPADIDIVWLSFPRPPEPLSTPLTEVWGATVPSNPSVDEAFVQKLMPARALGIKMGESIDDARERNPLLVRWPPEAENRYDTDDYFGQEWVFADQQTVTEKGRVVGIRYGSSASIGSKTTMVFANWLAEKFQPKELRESARGTDLLSIWNQGDVWLAAFIGLRDKTISVDMRVSGKGEQGLKAMFNQEHYSKPATADKNTFLSLAKALASKANADDFGVIEKLSLQNPITTTSPSSSGQVVMKKNGQDIKLTAPTAAQTAEATQTQTLAPPPSSRMKDEIRSMAMQRIETLGRVVQAYNAMPANLREAARVQSVAGAFGLLRKHAERYPELPLDDDLRQTMEWALVFLDIGKLQGSPALQKLAQVMHAEIALENAQIAAHEAAKVFAAARKAGCKELDKLKTIEDILQRLSTGVKGTGTAKNQLFIATYTPKQAAEAVHHLRYDAEQHTLRYIPKSVKVEGSNVPLEGIEALAGLIKETPPAAPATPVTGGTSQKPDDEVKQAALALCWVFNTAMASGMTELDDVKTVDDIIQRFKNGVQSGSQTHFLKSKLELAQAAKPYVQLDLKKKLLLLSPAGQNAISTGPMARQASPSLNYPGSPAEAERIAFNLAAAFGLAKSTGSKGLDNVKSVDAIIQRLNIGVNAGGDFAKTRFYVRTTTSQAAAAKPFLKFDPGNQSLFYQPGSMDANFHFPKPPPRSEAQTSTLASGSPDTQAQRTAQGLAAAYAAAVATGSKDIHQLQTLDAVIHRLTTTGLTSGPGHFEGRRFYIKIKPGEAAAAKPYLRYDSFTKTLQYSPNAIGGSRGSSTVAAGDTTKPQVMQIGRAVGGGVTYGGRTFANIAELTKALEETQAAAIQARDARAAQDFVSTYNAAMASGAKELGDVRTVDQALRRIMTGVNGGGPFKDRRFVVQATPEEAAAAKPYIEFDPRHQILVYKSPYR